MLRVFILLLFIPSMTFGLIPGISSAPYALLLLPFLNRFQLGRVFLTILFLYILTTFQSFIFDISLVEIFKSFIALINATIVIPFILNINSEDEVYIHKALVWYIIATILIGLLQSRYDLIKNISALIFGHASGFGEKGVPGLSYEPARSALDFIYALVGIYFFYREKHWFPYLVFISFTYLIFINRSLTGALLLMIFLGIKFLYNFNFKYIILIVTGIIIIPLVGLGIFEEDLGIHAIDSLKRLFNSSNKFELFQALSGHRGTGLIVSLQNISLFGKGGGSWEWLTQNYLDENFELISTIPYYRSAGIVASPPLTFFGRFIMEIGIIGLFIYFISLIGSNFVWKILKKSFECAEMLFLLISLIILSYGSNPIPFIVYTLIFKSLTRNEIRNKLYSSSE